VDEKLGQKQTYIKEGHNAARRGGKHYDGFSVVCEIAKGRGRCGPSWVESGKGKYVKKGEIGGPERMSEKYFWGMFSD